MIQDHLTNLRLALTSATISAEEAFEEAEKLVKDPNFQFSPDDKKGVKEFLDKINLALTYVGESIQ